ncbi:hypothetical protein [Neobacillus muris]|uniref:hypothetical protein n=1 Tax=Neobacillus muris TaxID=2941334 RepID=UPI00203D9E3F|nr:hypothetical protein [Neobacillus muris]
MYAVYFYENKNLLLCQLVKQVPSVGEDVKIKGRKGKVSSVTNEEDHYNIQVVLDKAAKKNQAAAPTKKKKK